MPPCTKLRRARPLLGTLVEIHVDAVDADEGMRAIDAAFDEVAAIHSLMSAHSDHGDVARINRAAAGVIVQLDERTCAVLALAREMCEASHGVFDVAIAPVLAERGLLPAQPRPCDPLADGTDIELLSGARVRLHRAVAIDLGGIAKGYAVDRAVAVLRACGVASGCVNAGGDLRVLGPDPRPVALRHPAAPTVLIPFPLPCERAMATSGGYFSRPGESAFVARNISRPSRVLPASVTVVADRCAVADALTKVAMLDPDGSLDVLAKYGAEALIFDHDGHTRATGAMAAFLTDNRGNPSCMAAA